MPAEHHQGIFVVVAEMYKNFTDSDMAAVFTYLQSIPAAKNRVPEPRPPVTLASAGS